MHPGKMIAFAEILDRELPVRAAIELELAIIATVEKRHVEFGPARYQVGMDVNKLWCIAREVDEHHIHPDV